MDYTQIIPFIMNTTLVVMVMCSMLVIGYLIGYSSGKKAGALEVYTKHTNIPKADLKINKALSKHKRKSKVDTHI